MYAIGRLSELSGVKVPTIRFYETRGLIDPPGRTAGNQRRYDRAALERLRFIRHARDLGLPLDDVIDLLSLEGATGPSLNRAHAIARNQRDGLRSRIARLQALEAELDRIVMACDHLHAGPDSTCAVLHALGHHDDCAAPHDAPVSGPLS
ncbi:MerR family transcriptional regulator [Arenibacterium halophilum]|uniref:Helix-turn-helix domain-containing protein n=1 Tax=Arenibacterium halophilum TaxID=2583821 RepID=A0ABY2X9C2_9RHOB|nr:helix-turn-helix domain-containing protein [Arenibacterium halophilum]TMV12976.1 helix-turn-helix domain-containing protein [Arenibacterium halophilum]